jgi:hypothetical protein
MEVDQEASNEEEIVVEGGGGLGSFDGEIICHSDMQAWSSI